jgi:hypothetical protein
MRLSQVAARAALRMNRFYREYRDSDVEQVVRPARPRL